MPGYLSVSQWVPADRWWITRTLPGATFKAVASGKYVTSLHARYATSPYVYSCLLLRWPSWPLCQWSSSRTAHLGLYVDIYGKCGAAGCCRIGNFPSLIQGYNRSASIRPNSDTSVRCIYLVEGTQQSVQGC